mmetsp:Transcript_12058/g.26326  ORF Transcript_12058/g.26326 Transcript_12058/m.26326 type:complete len:275 (+) Transcript_12058:565-1389(+)
MSDRLRSTYISARDRKSNSTRSSFVVAMYHELAHPRELASTFLKSSVERLPHDEPAISSEHWLRFRWSPASDSSLVLLAYRDTFGRLPGELDPFRAEPSVTELEFVDSQFEPPFLVLLPPPTLFLSFMPRVLERASPSEVAEVANFRRDAAPFKLPVCSRSPLAPSNSESARKSPEQLALRHPRCGERNGIASRIFEVSEGSSLARLLRHASRLEEPLPSPPGCGGSVRVDFILKQAVATEHRLSLSLSLAFSHTIQHHTTMRSPKNVLVWISR